MFPGHKVQAQQATQFTEWNTTQRLKNGQAGRRWAQQLHPKRPGQISQQRKA